MDMLWWILIVFCLAIGFLGCFIGRFPGPLLVLVATLVAKFTVLEPLSWMVIVVIAVLWLVSIYFNKNLLPSIAKNLQEYSKRATWGTTIGSILGVSLIIGMDLKTTASMIMIMILSFGILPFVFGFLLEFTDKKNPAATLKSTTSAYIVYLLSSIIKLIAFGYAIYAIFHVN